MTPKEAKMSAVMNVERGESIAGVWVAPEIPGIGIYKLVAKRKADGNCEWAHYVQRADGRKEKVYRGTVENQEQLKDVLAALNRAMSKTFSPAVQLNTADADFYTLDGNKLDSSIQ